MDSDFDFTFTPPDAPKEDEPSFFERLRALANAMPGRGAYLGDRSTLKHGFYSSFYKKAEHDAILKRRNSFDLSDEIEAIRVYVRRLIEKDSGDLTVIEYKELVRTLSFAFLSLTRLLQAQEILNPTDDLGTILRKSMHVVLDEIRQGGPKPPPLKNPPPSTRTDATPCVSDPTPAEK